MSDDANDIAVDGLAVAESVRNQFTRYVAFHSEIYTEEADTVTLRVMHTHAFEASEVTPYVLVTGPTESGGKSRVPEVAQYLVRQPVFKGVGSTRAGLFGGIGANPMGRPTVLLDEMDQHAESKPLREILNSGFEPGNPILRWKRTYNVFCPKMFTGIAGAKMPLTGTTLSRCIQIPIRRRIRGEELIERFRRKWAIQESVPIYRERAKWAQTNLEELSWSSPDTEGLVEDDRVEDSWEPLIAIADVLGGDWPERARKAMVTLTEIRVSEPTDNLALIRDLKRVWDQIDRDVAHTVELIDRLNGLEDREYSKRLDRVTGASRWVTSSAASGSSRGRVRFRVCSCEATTEARSPTPSSAIAADTHFSPSTLSTPSTLGSTDYP
jgi:hypothetical protein